MTDRELLELAAKAAGTDAEWIEEIEHLLLKGERGPDNSKFWNPLTDDGDALRLAVKLDINMRPTDGGMTVWAPKGARSFHEYTTENGDDKNAATRRVIVRAAAEIGKASRG